MKCSYTEVFAIASVNNLGRVDTSYAYWKGNNKVRAWRKQLREGRLIYAPEQKEGRDSNRTTEREHVSMKIPTFQRNRLYGGD